MLLGVRAVIAESFERIHRSNLVGMGVLPLQFLPRRDGARRSASPGRESYDIAGAGASAARRAGGHGRGHRRGRHDATGSQAMCASTRRTSHRRYRHGGILPYVLRQLAKRA